MRAIPILLFFGVTVFSVVGGSTLSRVRRQDWGFPEDTPSSESFPVRRPTTPTTTIGRRTTPTTAAQQTSTQQAAQQGASTSTQPPGVIFTIMNCDCPSPPQYNPVCGSDGNTYSNRQRLQCARRCGFQVDEVRLGACIRSAA